MSRIRKPNDSEQKSGSTDFDRQHDAVPGSTSLGEIHSRPAERRFWLPLSLGVFAICAGLLFFRLGHYPFWSDEADTALFARGIARTGDMSAVLDHNLYAYRLGSCLKNLVGRYQPPVSYYLAALFVGTDGTGSFWPRFPFAICGLLCVAMILYWMVRSQLMAVSWVVFSLGLIGNVSFFLYCRQCRYFALAILLTLVISYLYLHWNGSWGKLTAIMLASILLLGTQYLAYAGLYTALACDYLLFERRRRRLSVRQWLLLLAPQLLIGICVVAIYNPYGAEVAPRIAGHNLLLDKLKLLWWNLRDLNACEFGVGLLMLAAPVLYLFDKNRWLLRAPLAILSYIAIVTIFSPQQVLGAGELAPRFLVADIRYLSPLIPLCIFLTALVILTLARWKWLIALPLAILAFGTNVLNQPLNVDHWRCTSYQWLEELWVARSTSTERAIEWVRDNVQPGQSIWVMPEYMIYPLMYSAPEAVYAWQLTLPRQEQFRDWPAIHFVGAVPPDFILCFGRQRIPEDWIAKYQKASIGYTQVSTIDAYWEDTTRPELFWHGFESRSGYVPERDAVYIWQRDDLKFKAR